MCQGLFCFVEIIIIIWNMAKDKPEVNITQLWQMLMVIKKYMNIWCTHFFSLSTFPELAIKTVSFVFPYQKCCVENLPLWWDSTFVFPLPVLLCLPTQTKLCRNQERSLKHYMTHFISYSLISKTLSSECFQNSILSRSVSWWQDVLYSQILPKFIF